MTKATPDGPITLGDRVRDKISGFEGVATCRTAWLYGCIRWMVSPEKLDKGGDIIAPQVFDEPQLALVSANVLKIAPPPLLLAAPVGPPTPNYGARDDQAAMRR